MLLYVLPVILLSFGHGVLPFGLVDYNDDCEFDITDHSTFQSRYDQSKFCDTTRGLYCVPGLGKCGCIVPHTIYRAGKCRAMIGNTCLEAGNLRLDCVEHAHCTNNCSTIRGCTFSGTFKCQCIRGYLSNAQRTSCFPVTVGYNYDRRKYGYQYWSNSGNSLYSTPMVIITITMMCSLLVKVLQTSVASSR